MASNSQNTLIVSRRILQSILVVIGLIAVITGSLGMKAGIMDDFYAVEMGKEPGTIILDSNLRYFSGLWLGLGLILLWMVPSIERRRTIFRLVSVMIFIGGLGRIISMFDVGIPSFPFIIFTMLELFFPALILWQEKITGIHPYTVAPRPA